jgi:tetratricopeptide (TPR) repeat protein
MAADDPTRRIAPEVDDAVPTPTPSQLFHGETLPGEPIAPSAASVAVSREDLARGTAIGRYLVIDQIGRGGMGVVYAAYDPQLDRRIAIKQLRVIVADETSSGRARMQREAQALARLSHPNVIQIYDVGTHGDAIFIAMELAPGGTLRAWQVGKPWTEIVDAYVAAARGLAAAHAAGLIHRDFKPENVLRGGDGRIRVTDFGLVRAADAPVTAAEAAVPPTLRPSPHSSSPSSSSSSSSSSPSSSSSGHLDVQLTEAGTVMGTPAYMAPEQLIGAATDARSDQFSWCVALWEALYGARPFDGKDPSAVARAIEAGPPRPPSGGEVPRAIGRVLLRGLAADPAARWPTLDAAARALERAAFSRRRSLIIGGLAACAGAALLGVFVLGRSAAIGPECGRAGADLAELWTPAAQARLATAFHATGAPFADDALASVSRTLDGFSARWQAMAVGSCKATRIARTQSETVLDQRATCQARARDGVAALLDGLAKADRALVEQAPTLVNARLPDLDACDDVATLGGGVPRPRDPARARALRELEGRLGSLARVEMLHPSLAQAKAMIPIARGAIDDATKLGWPPIVGAAHRALGAVLSEAGDGKGARAAYLDAVASALASGDLDEVVELQLKLADVEAALTNDYALAASWGALAEGALARLGPRPLLRLRLARARGDVAFRAARTDEARRYLTAGLELAARLPRPAPLDELNLLTELLLVEQEGGDLKAANHYGERALALARAELGPNHPRYANIIHDLGTLAYHNGAYATAVARFREALALRERVLPPDAEELGTTLDALAVAEEATGDLAASRPHLLRAIDILTARLGADNPRVANALNDLGGSYHRQGDNLRALEVNLRALASRERALGPDHPDVAQSLINVAIESKALGRWAVVEPNYRRAIAIFAKAYGDDNANVGVGYINLGEALRLQGRLDPALDAYERARGILAKALGDDHPVLAHVWNGEGQLALARGHAAEAVTLLRRAVAMREQDAGDQPALAESRFALARALAPSGPPSAEARALAAAARRGFAAAGAGFVAEVAAIDRWLAGR